MAVLEPPGGDADLSFVQHLAHRGILLGILAESAVDPEVTGLMVTGSVARGDAFPRSDLDLQALLRDGCSRPFRAEVRKGIVVEISYADFDRARSKLEQNPMRVYAYLDGRILRDPQGGLARLTALARDRLARYRMPEPERAALAHWLKSARTKIAAAQEAGDLLRAVTCASTSSWQMVEGLWAVQGRPIPSSGALWAHVRDLTAMPPRVGQALRALFGGDAPERVAAALEILGWTLPLLDEGAEG